MLADFASQLHHVSMTEAFGKKLEDGGGIVALDWRAVPPASAQQGVVAVGNFDGVHRGHAALIGQARELARRCGGLPITIITFDPHPLQLLAPERFQPLLTTSADRAILLRQAGADAVVILQTDIDLLHLGPEAFFQQLLVERFRSKGLVEGFNFRFGRDRAGSVDMLREMSGKIGIPMIVVEPYRLDGEVVSSSRVRDALVAGDVINAARLLDRPYHVQGLVVPGAKRGRTIGFPTANLAEVSTLVPADGVYAVRAHVGAQTGPGAANVGSNPTFGENVRKIEVHLIDFTGDLYGQRMAVDFVQRLRDTRPFANATELAEQLKRDVEQARARIS